MIDKTLKLFKYGCCVVVGLILTTVIITAVIGGDSATATSVEPVATTTTVDIPALSQSLVGLSGPIGASVDGTTASGTLPPMAQLHKALNEASFPNPFEGFGDVVLIGSIGVALTLTTVLVVALRG